MHKSNPTNPNLVAIFSYHHFQQINRKYCESFVKMSNITANTRVVSDIRPFSFARYPAGYHDCRITGYPARKTV